MKNQKKRKNFNFLHESTGTSFDLEEQSNATAYSEDNPFFEIETSTEKKEGIQSKKEVRTEYWPFLEPI